MGDHDRREPESQFDPVLERVRETLAPLPRVEPTDVSRMLVAVRQRTESRTWREQLADRMWFARTQSVSVAAACAVAAVALIAGFVGRGIVDRGSPLQTVATQTEKVAAAALVATDSQSNHITAAHTMPVNTELDELRVPVQFVLNLSDAKQVAIVGEFNGWDAEAALLERVPGSSLWTTTQMLKPGRHVYSYVVDGTKWIRDPLAPQAIDADFGRPQSVIVVQIPWSGR